MQNFIKFHPRKRLGGSGGFFSFDLRKWSKKIFFCENRQIYVTSPANKKIN